NEAGILNGDELAMLKAIIQLEDLTAGDVMTPRVDIIGIDLADEGQDHAEVIQIAKKARRNFLVMYHETMDQVTGFLDVRRFLLDSDHRVDAATIKPYFVP